jgi:hypothetical protein
VDEFGPRARSTAARPSTLRCPGGRNHD